MSKKNWQYFLTIILILAILIIIYLDMMVYIAGPTLKDSDHEAVKTAIALALDDDVNEISFYNEYTLDQTIDVYEISTEQDDYYIFYGDNTVYFQLKTTSYNEESLNNYVQENYELMDYTTKLGLYADKPIIVIITTDQEIILDYYTYEEILRWEKI